MRRTTILGAIFAALVFVVLPVGAVLRFKAVYDDAMFTPHPSDRAKMAKALEDRFGAKVRLLSMSRVDRDINLFVGVVETAPDFPQTVYASEKVVFRFEPEGSQRVCLMTMPPRLARRRDSPVTMEP